MNSWNGPKIIIRMWVMGFILVWAVPYTFAFSGTDQAASEMLTRDGGSENEKTDAVVTWGGTHKPKRQVTPDAIPESSFGEVGPIVNPIPSINMGEGRAPASAVDSAPKVVLKPSNIHKRAQSIVREHIKNKSYQEVALIVNENGFFPSTLFITQGIPVHLFVTSASPQSQCLMSDTFQIHKQIKSQTVEEIFFTPEQTGAFSFGCPMTGHKGTVLVKALDLERLPASVTVSHSGQNEESE